MRSEHDELLARIDAAEKLVARVAMLWRVYQSADRDMVNGRPVDDALEEKSDAGARLDTLLLPITRFREEASSEAAIRALMAEVVERDAVIEQAGHGYRCGYFTGATRPSGNCTCFKSQAPRDALVARDAVRDKTVRAKALRDAAAVIQERQTLIGEGWLRARAEREESSD